MTRDHKAPPSGTAAEATPFTSAVTAAGGEVRVIEFVSVEIAVVVVVADFSTCSAEEAASATTMLGGSFVTRGGDGGGGE